MSKYCNILIGIKPCSKHGWSSKKEKQPQNSNSIQLQNCHLTRKLREVASNKLQLTDEFHLSLFMDFVEACRNAGCLAVQTAETWPNGLPGKGCDRLLDFHLVHRDLLLPHAEQLKVPQWDLKEEPQGCLGFSSNSIKALEFILQVQVTWWWM